MFKKYVILFLLSSNFYSNAQTMGLITHQSSTDGYVLFAPNFGDTTYLIDKCGYEVHAWVSTHQPGQSAYLLEDGTLLRTGHINNTTFNAGGLGGIIERFDWNGTLTWSYTISNALQCQHHDVRILPSGNVLAISYDYKTPAEAIAAGANPANLGTAIWSDEIIEIQPTGSTTGIVVWEWKAWDHLIQDFDATKPNYGVVADHPELLNVNYNLGTQADWLHCNGLDYNATLDQIVISAHNQNEIYILDHSTTLQETAGHLGGTHGKGGDFLYRWGNPAAYNRGVLADRKLFGQHNPNWIPYGYPDGGSIMIFNNGINRPAGNFSTVDVINTPIDANGDYPIFSGQSYQPSSAYWSYQAAIPTSFYAMNISGAQRLSNGNTIICTGPNGIFTEIDSNMTPVWKYISPVGQAGSLLTQGATPTQNSVFRSPLYELNYPGLAGHTLTPGDPIELSPLAYSCSMLTGLAETISNEQFSAYPNPFTAQINFQSQYAKEFFELRDCFGKLIYAGNSLSDQNFSKLSTGIYFLRMNSAQQNFNMKLAHQ